MCLQKINNGSNLVYLDNAATSQKPISVLKALQDYYESYNSNVHRGIHYLRYPKKLNFVIFSLSKFWCFMVILIENVYLLKKKTNLGNCSAKATEKYEQAREKIAAFINAEESREIVFTRNATEAINLVAYTWGFANLKSGDEVGASF